MSRLAAKANLLYYPTPNEVVDGLAPFLSVSLTATTIRILDPCAGTGEACARLAALLAERHPTRRARQPLQIDTYGIEPHVGRFKQAKACLTAALHASFFQTTLSSGDGDDQGWQCLFLNPPYDQDSEQVQRTGKAQRLEVSFLQRATARLAPCGVLIYIIPQHVLDDAAEWLASWYTNLLCYRFPDPLYEPFKQVIVLAQRHTHAVPLVSVGRTVYQLRQWATLGEQLPALPTCPPYQLLIPDAPDVPLLHFHEGMFDAQATAALAVSSAADVDEERTGLLGRALPLQGVWASESYWQARLPPLPQHQQASMQPLAPLNRAHIAVLAVAGVANRAILTSEQGQQVLVKGYARKRVRVQETEDEQHWIRTETDTFDTGLWCLALTETPGALTRVGTDAAPASGQEARLPTTSLDTFLSEYGLALTQQLEQLNPPRYRSEEQLPWRQEALAALTRQPWHKQREIVLAGALALQRPHQALALVAEMATGKTFLAGAIAFVADRFACGGMHPLGEPSAQHLFPLVVLCPPIMVRKWQRELEQTIPGCQAVIVRRLASERGTKTKRRTTMAAGTAEEEEEVASSEDLAALRRLVPDLPTPLSALGVLERVIVAIGRQLADWQQDYERTVAANRALWRAYGEVLRHGEQPVPPTLHPLPGKPCHVVIVSNSTAKFGMPWQPVYRQKVVRTRDESSGRLRALRDEAGRLVRLPACPDCGRLLKDAQVEQALLKLDEQYAARKQQQEQQRAHGTLSVAEEEAATPVQVWWTERSLLGSGDKRVKRHCPACGAALWSVTERLSMPAAPTSQHDSPHVTPPPLPPMQRPTVQTTDTRRYPLADYLLRRHKGFFKLLVADEMHEGTDGTALNFARQSLAAACGRMIGLTGTLSNGYASNLFRLYWTINPAVRQRFGYHEVGAWIDAYGRREVVTRTRKEYESGDGALSKRKVGMPTVKEIPGFSPQGLVHVLPVSLFLELVEVAPHLPPYEEIVQPVALGEPLHTAYHHFERETTATLAQMLARGDMGGLSSWLHGLLIYPNMPWLGWVCRHPRTGAPFGIAPQLPETPVYPKEQKLIELCQQEVAQGRRVLIYTENTGTCDILPRLEHLLRTHVTAPGGRAVRVACLRSTTVATIEREAWLDRQVKSGCDILICNPRLVKVGLDLLAFPTIVYLSLPLSTADLRQSARRSWRPGQTRPVRVFFLVYPTMEARMLRLMARKTKASLMVEGKLPSEGLVSLGEEEGEAEGLAAHLARELLAVLPAPSPAAQAAPGQQEKPSLPRADEDVLAELETLFAPLPTPVAAAPEHADSPGPQERELIEVSSQAEGKETAEGVASVALPMNQALESQPARGVSAGSSTSGGEATPVPAPVQRPPVTAAPDAVAQHSTPRLVFGCLEQIRQARPAVCTRRRTRSNGVAVTAQPTLWDTAASEAEPPDTTSPQSDRPAALYWSALEQATRKQGSLWK